MPYDTTLATRIRSALAPRPTRERSMFGGLSFMVDERMVVSARGGELLVRVDPSRYDELLGIEGAEPALMKDRVMGRGWLTVGGEAVATDEQLDFWLGVGLEAIGG